MRIENSFIPIRGVGETTERNLWEAGVTHWDDFDGSVVGPSTADRIAEFIGVARDHLAAGDTRFFAQVFPSGEQWRLYEDFAAETCFFDIETTGLDASSNDVTTVSFHQDGETTTLVRGRDLTADALRREFADARLLASFNGKRFDVPFLEESFGLSIDTPHLDMMYPCRRLDLTGGLKRIESDLDIDRDRPDLSGRDAVRLWREYERGDDDALDTLVSYNREDTENLRTLADEVTDRLHRDVFPHV
ncbi:ribonuclease H-like domain-containing protein [Salinirarus marinus]|uniref:ribonuclease H-like domain-containing protein n=1 Tax=Salinirarus marinus TaxID=3068310 RepID=UPI003C6C11D8